MVAVVVAPRAVVALGQRTLVTGTRDVRDPDGTERSGRVAVQDARVAAARVTPHTRVGMVAESDHVYTRLKLLREARMRSAK